VVGAAVGSVVGAAVGSVVGAAVGSVVGAAVGSVVGAADGSVVGAAIGVVVGAAIGVVVGAADGSVVGAAIGAVVGAAIGVVVGAAIGPVVGDAIGVSLCLTSNRRCASGFFNILFLPPSKFCGEFWPVTTGINPDKEFLPKLISCEDETQVVIGFIVVNKLFDKSNVIRGSNAERTGGNGPVRGLDSRAVAVADIILPIIEGIAPINEFPSKLRLLNDASKPKEASIGPAKESRFALLDLMLVRRLLMDLGIVP
jgi:uncharacterized protein YcfJ